MRFPGEIIFYWIHKAFPSSTANLSKDYQVISPVFLSSEDEIRSHLVVLNTNDILYIDHHYTDTIFLCRKENTASLQRFHNQYIAVENSEYTSGLFNQVQKIFDMLAEWRRNLHIAQTSQSDFQKLLQCCDPLLEDPLILTDTYSHFITSSGEAMPKKSNNQIKNEKCSISIGTVPSTLSSATRKHRDVFSDNISKDILHINIFNRDTCVGQLSISCSGDEGKSAFYKYVLRIVVCHAEQLYVKLGSFWEQSNRKIQFKKALSDVLSGHTADPNLLVKLSFEKGGSIDGPFHLVLFQPHLSHPDPHANDMLCDRIESEWPGLCSFQHQGNILALVNLAVFERMIHEPFCQKLNVFLKNHMMLAGLSRQFTDLDAISTALRQAQAALEIGPSISSMSWYFLFDDYALVYLLKYGYRDFPLVSSVKLYGVTFVRLFGSDIAAG